MREYFQVVIKIKIFNKKKSMLKSGFWNILKFQKYMYVKKRVLKHFEFRKVSLRVWLSGRLAPLLHS